MAGGNVCYLTDISDWQLAPINYRQFSVRYDVLIANVKFKITQPDSTDIDVDAAKRFLEQLEEPGLSIDIIKRGLLACGYTEDSMRFKWALVVIGAKKLYA